MKIIWAGGRTSPPADQPKCGWEKELCLESDKRGQTNSPQSSVYCKKKTLNNTLYLTLHPFTHWLIHLFHPLISLFIHSFSCSYMHWFIFSFVITDSHTKFASFTCDDVTALYLILIQFRVVVFISKSRGKHCDWSFYCWSGVAGILVHCYHQVTNLLLLSNCLLPKHFISLA